MKALNSQQTKFVIEFCKEGNQKQAAIDAGYSAKTAAEQGYQLRHKPAIAAAITARLKALSMDAEEATKHVSDIAHTRLNEYLKIDEKWETPLVRKSLGQLIMELQEEIEIDKEFMDRVTLSEKNMEKMWGDVQEKQNLVVRYEIELERNPAANRIVQGDAVLVRHVGVDLEKLSNAQEKGRIKKLSFNERGLPSVELCSAEGALETILKIHGKLIQKVDLNDGMGIKEVDLSKLTPEQKSALVALARSRKP